MKRRSMVLWASIFLTLLLPATTVWSAEGLSKISDGVYAYTNIQSGGFGNQFGVNSGIVVGDDSVLVVDTRASAKEATLFLKDIRKMTDKPIRYVVNTHYHLDHAFGNCVFADLGASIISHVKCRGLLQNLEGKALETAKVFGMDETAMEGTRVIVPGIAFEKELELDLGNRTVTLLYSRQESHTAGSIIIWIAKQKVAFAGDILFTDFHPYIADSNLDGWSKSLDFLLALGADKIIPGHGPMSDAKDVRDMKAYLATFDSTAKSLSASPAINVEQATKEMVKRLPKRKDGHFLIPANLTSRYMKSSTQEK